MKSLIAFIFIYSVGLIAQAQEGLQGKKEGLTLGDKIPAFKFNHVVNYNVKELKSFDFDGKLLILDFWSTGCASCIESWPKLEKLQSKFGSKIQILLVNPWQDEKVVTELIEKRRKLGIVDLTIPSVCKQDEPNLLQWFKIDGVPHVVWIDKNQTIKSITSNTELTAENIEGILSNQNVKMVQKIVLRKDINYSKPLFVFENAAAPAYATKWQSTLTKYIDGLQGTFNCNINSSENEYFISMLNHPLLDFYRYAYSNQLDDAGYLTRIDLNKVVLQTSDSLKFIDRDANGTILDNFYSYQLISGRLTSRNELQQYMQEDLHRYFGYDVKWEKRKKQCLVFSAPDTGIIAFKEGKRTFQVDDTKLVVNDYSLNHVITFFKDATKYYNSPYPMLDETGFKGKLGNININANIYDYTSLSQALQKYGINLSLQERVVDVLVIKDERK